MSLLSRVTKSNTFTLFQLYCTPCVFHRNFRVSVDHPSKASILAGAGLFFRQCSSESSPRDDPVARYSTVILGISGSGGGECELKSVLDKCGLPLSEELVWNVLRKHRWEWRLALSFFNWTLSREDYTPGSRVRNEMLDILGRAKEINLMRKVFDEMPERNGDTFGILSNRYAGNNRVQEAVDAFYKRKDYGLVIDLAAFETLLVSLCRYKHVQEAETLVLQKQMEFLPTIKIRNIILNGWCILGRHREAERFWNDILASGCKPDLFTYGTFINSLVKAGKLPEALELFKHMWENGCPPDVVVCNCIIDALCFKNRIPDAHRLLKEMSERGCQPNVETYNTLIKYTCKIRKKETAYGLLNEMQKVGLHPDSRTFMPFLKASLDLKEVSQLLERMRGSGCEIDSCTYNLILILYIRLNYLAGVERIWAEMGREGLGPSQQSYTYCINWLCRKGRFDEAMRYYSEMQSKGIKEDKRTKILMDEVRLKTSRSTS